MYIRYSELVAVIKINVDRMPSMLLWFWQWCSRKFCSFIDVPYINLNFKRSNSLNPQHMELPTHVKKLKLFSLRFVLQFPLCGKTVFIYQINFGTAHPHALCHNQRTILATVSVSDSSSVIRLSTIQRMKCNIAWNWQIILNLLLRRSSSKHSC
jgi:hypothetical protein